jgi:hypothetical protein
MSRSWTAGQRPHAVRRRHDAVQRIERKLGGDPARRGHQAGGQVSPVRVCLLDDQREEALRVGVAADHAAIVAEALLERR